MSDTKKIKVLVVEDEDLIRMTAVDILEEAGFIVEEASDSHEAVLVLRAVADLHVLFTDIHMPGEIDGLELAYQTARDYPDVGIVIVSARASLEQNMLPNGALFLAKPYAASHVISHIHKVATAFQPREGSA